MSFTVDLRVRRSLERGGRHERARKRGWTTRRRQLQQVVGGPARGSFICLRMLPVLDEPSSSRLCSAREGTPSPTTATAITQRPTTLQVRAHYHLYTVKKTNIIPLPLRRIKGSYSGAIASAKTLQRGRTTRVLPDILGTVAQPKPAIIFSSAHPSGEPGKISYARGGILTTGNLKYNDSAQRTSLTLALPADPARFKSHSPALTCG